MTAEDVLEELDFEDGHENTDDFDEPMMPGSDDEFSDCDLDEEEDDDVSDVEGSYSSSLPHQPSPQRQTSAQALPPDWSSKLTPLTIGDFTSTVGPTVPVPETASEVFDLMFTPSFLDTIVKQSNLYAEQVMGEDKYASWKKLTREELRAYIGFSIQMGIVRLPALDDYWSTDPTLHYSPIADRISRDRFREISRYLHFVDNTTLHERGTPGYDRLGKVRPVIDHLSTKFAEIYEPHKEVAVDEAMIKFTGRSSVKQYMPMKPIKRGIKVHAHDMLTTAHCTRTHTHMHAHTHTHTCVPAHSWHYHTHIIMHTLNIDRYGYLLTVITGTSIPCKCTLTEMVVQRSS